MRETGYTTNGSYGHSGKKSKVSVIHGVFLSTKRILWLIMVSLFSRLGLVDPLVRLPLRCLFNRVLFWRGTRLRVLKTTGLSPTSLPPSTPSPQTLRLSLCPEDSGYVFVRPLWNVLSKKTLLLPYKPPDEYPRRYSDSCLTGFRRVFLSWTSWRRRSKSYLLSFLESYSTSLTLILKEKKYEEDLWVGSSKNRILLQDLV